ncbi:zinc ribbon domain-containing protein [Streptomyces sp. 769]|uniref:RNA-guided endonuclease InsQ/TnpB family protein n=1 Tax=Streptomyces sp. 769 TaxID=1262452 RepID=UPI00057D9BD0|nr:zinc ribbon domain-containing protein [Streptomyces sp. 769]
MTARAGTGAVGHARYTFRLRVSATAGAALREEWGRCRWVWNECVAKSRATHQHNQVHPQENRTCGPAQLDRMLTEARRMTPWLRAGSSVPQQQIIRDFGRSRAKALNDIKERLPLARRAGMPGHKTKREARPTLNYTRSGFNLKDGRLQLAGGIVLTVVWSRTLPGEASSVRVSQDSLGHWYASFVVPATIEPLPMMARRKPAKGQPAPKGYREAKKLRAKAHQKVARQRQDTARMGSPLLRARRRAWGRSKKVVRDHDALAVEDFKSNFLAKSSMARKAADAAIGATKQALIEMGRKHGRDVRLVHPAYTTMDCAQCGARAKHALPLSERTYTCTACGAVKPRDKNSARLILIRAGLLPAGVEGVRPSGALSRKAA